jgi:hypothetical protein
MAVSDGERVVICEYFKIVCEFNTIQDDLTCHQDFSRHKGHRLLFPETLVPNSRAQVDCLTRLFERKAMTAQRLRLACLLSAALLAASPGHAQGAARELRHASIHGPRPRRAD